LQPWGLFAQGDTATLHIETAFIGASGVVQALVAAFGKWENEWLFLERILSEDLRNNSAWAQRAFLLTHKIALLIRPRIARVADCCSGEAAFLAEVLAGEGREEEEEGHSQVAVGTVRPPEQVAIGGAAKKNAVGARAERRVTSCLRIELAAVVRSVHTIPHNESAWNYLTGLPHIIAAALAECSDGNVPTTCSSPPDSALVPGQGRVHELAHGYLRTCSDAVQQDIAEALLEVSQATFSTALAVLESSKACIPARVALLKAYAAAANADVTGREKALEASRRLALTLSDMDPIHCSWYMSFLTSG
jgi:hypothetical protein